jgi:DNA polymerase V
MPATVIQLFNPDATRQLARPLFSSAVQAGFPSPADDYLERELDLNEHCIKHPAATYYVRVSGDSMEKAGIYHDDILIVDRSLEARDGSIVVAVLDGELTVKRLSRRNGTLYLVPENDAYPVFEIQPDREFLIWGVVTGVVRTFDV